LLRMLRARLTYANVVATAALFVQLGGSAYAAITITGRNVPKDALTGADIKNLTGRDVRNNTLTGADVRRLTTRDVTNGRLLAEDFAPGQLPAGPKGDKGDKGDPATRLFARVAGKAADTVLGPSQGVTGVTWNSSGDYTVVFDRDVSSCAAVASSGWANSGGSEFVDRSAVASVGVPIRANEVRVILWGDEGPASLRDVSFNLAVFC
jgi:hypothetical protein